MTREQQFCIFCRLIVSSMFTWVALIGVATENKDKAVDLIEAKGVTFDNYFQDQAFLDQFNIKGWPTYLLVDQSGIIVKEYFGFNAQIEKDILELINE